MEEEGEEDASGEVSEEEDGGVAANDVGADGWGGHAVETGFGDWPKTDEREETAGELEGLPDEDEGEHAGEDPRGWRRRRSVGRGHERGCV